MTQEELQALQQRVRSKAVTVAPVPAAKAVTTVSPRKMNKSERKYNAYLNALLREGEIAWFEYEPIKLRLADGCLYIPDFMVVSNEGFIELHDVKAWWRSVKKVGMEDDALVKLKCVAEKYPLFKVVATWEKDGRWEQRVFGVQLNDQTTVK